MWRKREPHTEDTKDTEDTTMVLNLHADPPPCSFVTFVRASSETPLLCKANAFVLLVEGDCELTESFQADIPDVAQRGKHDRSIREFVVAALNHVFHLNLFDFHVPGGAA